MAGEEPQVFPEGRVLPLNSKRLLAAHVRELAEELGLPTQTTTDEVRQLIKGDLTTRSREPRNVQVIVQEPAEDSADGEVCLHLVDGVGGVIAKRVVSARKRPDSQSSNKGSEGSELPGEVVGGLQEEIAALREQLEAKKRRADEAEALASTRVELVVVERL